MADCNSHFGPVKVQGTASRSTFCFFFYLRKSKLLEKEWKRVGRATRRNLLPIGINIFLTAPINLAALKPSTHRSIIVRITVQYGVCRGRIRIRFRI